MDLGAFDARRATIPTRRGAISVIDTGDIGAGPAAVFVHGVGTNAYLWRHVIGRLSREHRCVALDLPLHGRSPARADQAFSLGALAEVVADLCDGLDLAAIHLVAHDTGGALAQIFAARHPDRLVSLTLTNCETHDNVPPDAFKPTVELARAGQLAPAAPGLLADLGAARAAVFAMGYEDPERLSTDMVRAFLEPVIGTAEAAKLFERLLASLEPDDLLRVEPALAQLTVPTLVVWGTGDEFFDLRWAYWLRDTIPGVTRVIEIEGAKLFFPDERADDLAPHLRRHWAAAERARVGA
jgi:pimeloyl-ACP methyl ester carboxylesterase